MIKCRNTKKYLGITHSLVPSYGAMFNPDFTMIAVFSEDHWIGLEQVEVGFGHQKEDPLSKS
jgi:hypothetical protein